MKRWAIRIGLGVLTLLAFLVCFVIASFIYAFTAPAEAFKIAQDYILPSDLQVTWTSVTFKPKSDDWLHWDIEWKAENLLVKKADPGVDLPIDSINLRFSISPWGTPIRVHHFTFKATKPMAYAAGPSEPTPEQNYYELINDYLEYLTMATDWIEFKHLDVAMDELKIYGDAGVSPTIIKLVLQKPQASKPLSLNVAVQEEKSYFVQVDGTYSRQRFDGKFALRADALALSQKIVGSFLENEFRFDLQGETTYAEKDKDPIRADSKIKLGLKAEGASITATGALTGLPAPFQKLPKIDLNLDIPFEEEKTWGSKPSTYRLKAPLTLYFISKEMRKPVEKTCQCRLPELLNMQSEGKIWLATYFAERTDGRAPLFDAKVDVDPLANKLFSLDLALSAKGFKENHEVLLEPALASALVVHSFQGLKTFLDGYGIMVPAPFHVLEGKIRVRADGPVTHNKDAYQIPVSANVALASKNQTVDFDTEAKVSVTKKMDAAHVAVNTLIHQIQIELPPIDPIRGIPAFVPDARIVEETPRKKKPGKQFKIEVDVSVKTEKPAAIRLLSHLAKPNVPITLDVQVEGEKTSGFVNLEPFRIVYLKRATTVERFKLSLKAVKPGVYPLDGRLRFDQTQYKVFIDIGGTSESPQLQFSSEPYLDRADIVSVLIYDQTTAQLASGEAETAGNVNAAVADRAIGLFGIWMFASTPIRSFSYNRATGTYRATVLLADGVTAAVGRSEEQSTSLELRKRLSQRWVITASWGDNTNRDDVGKLTLQWERRY